MESPLEEPGSTTLTEVRLVLIGERWSGKSFSGNTILGKDALECGRARTAHTEVRHARAEGRRLVVVDGPGWSGSLSLAEIPEVDKQRFKLHASACPPGPHAFLLVVPLDTAFSAGSRRTVEEHMKLLGEAAWRHTLLLFTCGDFLRKRTIEQHIEGEGESLRWLTERCGNRFHVFHNKEKGNLRQVQGLLEKVEEMAQRCGFFRLDEATLNAVKEKQREAEERAKERKRRAEEQRRQRRELFPDATSELLEITIVMLGQKTSGKSATGNHLLSKEVFPTCENKTCQVAEGSVAGRSLTVIDTPGWRNNPSACTEAQDKEIVRGLSLSPQGVHAVLLAVAMDQKFGDDEQAALEAHVGLLGAGVWRHAVVLLTHGDSLAGRSVEEHIELESGALRRLVERCENRYHVVNNSKRAEPRQTAELFQKIEEMVAANGGQLFHPEVAEVHLRIEEKFASTRLKEVMRRRLEAEFRQRELELMEGFKETLLHLQGSVRSRSNSLSVVQKKVGKSEERINRTICLEIEKLDKEMKRKSSVDVQSSMDFLLPEFSTATPASQGGNPSRRLVNVLGWLSKLQVGEENFSQTSGYRSELDPDPNDLNE
uniref:AIG1-type G domain-containing protein n=1 Tax=Gasterosteus aculeatus aculeatus TaxID=481459 RepID=A0AAQ4REF5_GASAC